MTALVLGIDAGHSQANSGAHGHGISEAGWAMDFAHYCYRLARHRDGLTPVLLRTYSDVGRLTFSERAARALEARCDLVIVHHLNAAVNDKAEDALFFARPDDVHAYHVAHALGQAMPPELRGKRTAAPIMSTADGYEMRPHNTLRLYRCTAVLCEWGFVSHVGDAAALKRPEIQDAIAHAVVFDAVRAYCKSAGRKVPAGIEKE